MGWLYGVTSDTGARTRRLEGNLNRVGVTPGDLHEQLRSVLNTNDLGCVREAFLERGGNVSFIPR